MKGEDGHTPVKGEDYFTDEDVEKIIEDVLEQGVLTYNEQVLSDEQKTQARKNIGIDQISFNKLTEDLDAGENRIRNLAPPVEDSDAATKAYVQTYTFDSSAYVAIDDGKGNVEIRPYLADEDELTFRSHIDNQQNPHKVTAEQVGARPVGWKPTAAEIGAATPQDVNTAKTEAVTAAQTYTDQQVKNAAPRNLLDNSDFRNPVNQRGLTRYAADGYTLDRWTMWIASGTGSVDIHDGYISVTFQNHGSVVQRFEKGVLDPSRTYTCVYKKKDEAPTVIYPMTIIYDVTDDYVTLADLWNGASESLEWVALYEGEYTTETLPAYQPKGYSAELAACRRYYFAGDVVLRSSLSHNGNVANIVFPTQMRLVPTVSVNTVEGAVPDVINVSADGVSWYSQASFTFDRITASADL